MSQESLPPEADELAELRREALQLLRESLRAARVPPAQRCALLARFQPPAAPGGDASWPPSYNYRRCLSI